MGGTGTGGLIDTLSRLIAKSEYTIGKWVQAVGRAKEFISKMLKKYAPLYKCECGKEYKHIQSFNRHTKNCIVKNSDREKRELRQKFE